VAVRRKKRRAVKRRRAPAATMPASLELVEILDRLEGLRETIAELRAALRVAEVAEKRLSERAALLMEQVEAQAVAPRPEA